MGRVKLITACLVFLPIFTFGQQEPLEHYSLRSYCPTPANQKKSYACQSFAVAYAMSISKNKSQGITQKRKKNKNRFSANFFYNFPLKPINQEKHKVPCIQRVVRIATTYGCLPVSEFSENKLNRFSLNKNQLAKAKKWKASSAWQVNKSQFFEDNRSVVKQLIQSGLPVIVQVKLWGSFQKIDKKEIWTTSDTTFYRGAHSLVIIGFDDENECFEVLNSWGKKWGDRGFAYIDYRAMQDILLSAFIVVQSDYKESFFLQKKLTAHDSP